MSFRGICIVMHMSAHDHTVGHMWKLVPARGCGWIYHHSLLLMPPHTDPRSFVTRGYENTYGDPHTSEPLGLALSSHFTDGKTEAYIWGRLREKPEESPRHPYSPYFH